MWIWMCSIQNPSFTGSGHHWDIQPACQILEGKGTFQRLLPRELRDMYWSMSPEKQRRGLPKGPNVSSDETPTRSGAASREGQLCCEGEWGTVHIFWAAAWSKETLARPSRWSPPEESCVQGNAACGVYLPSYSQAGRSYRECEGWGGMGRTDTTGPSRSWAASFQEIPSVSAPEVTEVKFQISLFFRVSFPLLWKTDLRYRLGVWRDSSMINGTGRSSDTVIHNRL